MKVRDFIKLIEGNGWKLDRIKGSHRQYIHPEKPEAGTLTVAGHPFKDVPKGLLNAMLKQAVSKLSNKYAVVIEKGETSYGASVPDLPGCYAVGDTKREVEQLISEAITLHIESLREHGNQVPEPSFQVEYIEPAAVA